MTSEITQPRRMVLIEKAMKGLSTCMLNCLVKNHYHMLKNQTEIFDLCDKMKTEYKNECHNDYKIKIIKLNDSDWSEM